MHGVFGNVLGLHGLKGACPHMQSDARSGNAHVFQLAQQSLVKMQRCSGCGYSTRDARKHRLIPCFVFCNFCVCGAAIVGPLNVGRQWHVAILRHEGMRLGAEFKAKQSAFFIRPTADQGGLKPFLVWLRAGQGCSAHVKRGANGRFFAHLHVRHHAVPRQNPLDQKLHFAAA